MCFYLSILYLVVEYMRPQSMYEAIWNYPLAKVVVIGMAVAFILERKRLSNRNVLNIFLLAYLFWFSVSTILAYNHDLAFDLWVDFLKWVIIYFLLINCINERGKLYIFVIALLILNFKIAQFVVRVWIDNGFYSDPRGLHAGAGVGSGFFKNPNDMGAAFNSIAGISPALGYYDNTSIQNRFKMKWIHIICAISFGIAIIATSSRGAFVAFLAVLSSLLFKVKKKWLYLLTLSFIAVISMSLIPADNWKRFEELGSKEDQSGQQRLNLWAAGFKMANEHPLTGVGPNNFGVYNQTIYNAGWRTVQHNIFIQAVSELGYPGLALLVCMIISTFKNNRDAREILKGISKEDPFLIGLSHGLDLCLIGFVVNGFFITVLYYPLFWMIMSMSVSLRNIAEKERSTPIGELKSGFYPNVRT